MYKKANERLKKATVKTKALLGYCKRGWKTTNIVKSHVIGATMYGVRIVGIKPDQLAKVRALIRSTTTSSNSGGSTTAVLALQRCKNLDLAYRATTLPVMEWAERVNRAHYERDDTVKHRHRDAWEAQ